MNAISTTRRVLSIALAAGTLGLVFATPTVDAQVVRRRPLRIPTAPFSVALDEGARLHVARLAAPDATPSIVRLQLLDEGGQTIAHRTVTLLPGHTASLSLGRGGQGLIRGQVDVLSATPREGHVVSAEVHAIDDLAAVRRYICSIDGIDEIRE